MKLDPAGVEKAARQLVKEWLLPAHNWVHVTDDVACVLTAYFDHLREVGLMREGCGVDYGNRGVWDAITDRPPSLPEHFPCLILRTDKE